jgi:hypothetical protein
MSTTCHYDKVLRRQLEEQEVGMRWPSPCEDVSLGAEECPLLEAVTKQHSDVTQNTSLYVINKV